MTSQFSSRKQPKRISTSRTHRTQEIRITHYIVVEGQETEKKYFDAVTQKTVSNYDVRIIAPGSARETLFSEAKRILGDLTREAKALGKGFKASDVGVVWIVCDVDDEGKKLVELCARKESKEIRWVISNPSFDAWLGMHFEGVVTGYVDRHKLQSKLRSMKVLLGSNSKTIDMQSLQGKYEMAKKTAIRHEKKHEAVTYFPHNNPSSNVYELVDRLNPRWK